MLLVTLDLLQLIYCLNSLCLSMGEIGLNIMLCLLGLFDCDVWPVGSLGSPSRDRTRAPAV